MQQLRAIVHNGVHIFAHTKIAGQIEAQGDAIRANQYGAKMRLYDPNTVFLMVPGKVGQIGYMLTRDEKKAGVTFLDTLIREKRIKFYHHFISVGKRAFKSTADFVNPKHILSTLVDQCLRLRYDERTHKITGKDGPGKQDDGVTTLAMGIYESNRLRRDINMLALH